MCFWFTNYFFFPSLLVDIWTNVDQQKYFFSLSIYCFHKTCVKSSLKHMASKQTIWYNTHDITCIVAPMHCIKKICKYKEEEKIYFKEYIILHFASASSDPCLFFLTKNKCIFLYLWIVWKDNTVSHVYRNGMKIRYCFTEME